MKLDLDAIKARADAATPGPWAWDNRGDKCDDIQLGVACDAKENPLTGYFDDDDAIYVEQVAESLSRAADADFIAHARTDVPALCDAVERLTADLSAAVAELAAWKRAETERVPQCFNCGAPCYVCLLYKTVLAERDEARALVLRRLKGSDALTFEDADLARARWNAEKAGGAQ
jgi:hypothetical protein